MNKVRQAAFGTPPVTGGETEKIEIDGLPATVKAGTSVRRATITERVNPGVVYTTFHNPETDANVVTAEYSDWAANCPEYKVTAVQVSPATRRSEWQHIFEERARRQGKILETS